MDLQMLKEEAVQEKPKVQVKERTKSFLSLPKTRQQVILEAAVEYSKLNQQEKLLKARRDKELRPIIEEAADTLGIEDQNGHMHLVISEDDVDVEIIRTKKISRILNSVMAEEILKKKGLYDSCVIQVVSYDIDEEKIIEAYEAGRLTAAELDDMFSENISWATSVKTNHPDVKFLEEERKRIEKQPASKELPTIGE